MFEAPDDPCSGPLQDPILTLRRRSIARAELKSRSYLLERRRISRTCVAAQRPPRAVGMPRMPSCDAIPLYECTPAARISATMGSSARARASARATMACLAAARALSPFIMPNVIERPWRRSEQVRAPGMLEHSTLMTACRAPSASSELVAQGVRSPADDGHGASDRRRVPALLGQSQGVARCRSPRVVVVRGTSSPGLGARRTLKVQPLYVVGFQNRPRQRVMVSDTAVAYSDAPGTPLVSGTVLAQSWGGLHRVAR
jgi:hypothetical protein